VEGQLAVSSRRRVLSFAAVAALLAWEVLSRSFVAYLGNVAPDAALYLRSDPKALLSVADNALNAQRTDRDAEQGDSILSDRPVGRLSAFARPEAGFAGSERDAGPGGDPADAADPQEQPASPIEDALVRAQVRAWAEMALLRDPLSARGLRILGQVADAEADDEKATRFMQAAARHSLRETAAVYWMMRKRFEEHDHAAAIHYADVLLRTRQNGIAYAIPTLARIAENKDAVGSLKETLATNPPWRGQFFTALNANITDAGTPLELLLGLKTTPNPPTLTDLRNYLNFLIKHQYYELAYYSWLQFLPARQLRRAGMLFNGSFELAPSGLPFDWVIMPGSGVTIDIARKRNQDGDRGLYVEFGHGRVDFRGVAQLVALPPGTYQLAGMYRGQVVGRRGLEWRVTCAGADTKLIGKSAISAMGAATEWTEFVFLFTVPPTDCRAQYVRLALEARSASERLLSGAIWYDDLRITRSVEVGAWP